MYFLKKRKVFICIKSDFKRTFSTYSAWRCAKISNFKNLLTPFDYETPEAPPAGRRRCCPHCQKHLNQVADDGGHANRTLIGPPRVDEAGQVAQTNKTFRVCRKVSLKKKKINNVLLNEPVWNMFNTRVTKNSFSPCSALLLASFLALHSGSVLVLAFLFALLRLFATDPKA